MCKVGSTANDPALRDAHIEVPSESDSAELSDMPDWQLMTAVAAHRSDALAALYRRHSESVSATTRRMLGKGPTCEDVVADVFISLWRSPEKFDPDRGSLLGYLRMKAKGRSVDIYSIAGADGDG